MTREELIEKGGIVDDLRGSSENVTFFRIANPDGSLPAPPTLVGGRQDTLIVFSSDGTWR